MIHGTDYYVKIMVQGGIRRLELYRLHESEYNDNKKLEDRLRHCYAYVPELKAWLYVVNMEIAHPTMSTTWVKVNNVEQLNEVVEWLEYYSK